MKYTILIIAEARQDELEAYNYYEDLRTGLGEELLIILEQHYIAISENPFLYSFTDENKTLRDVTVLRFPYVIIYEIKSSIVVVYAVHNTYKKPRI